MFRRNRLTTALTLLAGLAVLTGNCAQLSADRTTEFHGNPATSNLNLAMAGNQWVVFNKVMQAFNERRAQKEKNIDLTAIGNQPRTLAGLQNKGADYFIELIPPGQERRTTRSRSDSYPGSRMAR